VVLKLVNPRFVFYKYILSKLSFFYFGDTSLKVSAIVFATFNNKEQSFNIVNISTLRVALNLVWG
jgi:hypothetical protein